MNSGSRSAFRIPPPLRPMLAWLEKPALRSRCASVSERIEGRLPITITIRA